VTNARLEEENH
jgi:hypothetical protein